MQVGGSHEHSRADPTEERNESIRTPSEVFRLARQHHVDNMRDHYLLQSLTSEYQAANQLSQARVQFGGTNQPAPVADAWAASMDAAAETARPADGDPTEHRTKRNITRQSVIPALPAVPAIVKSISMKPVPRFGSVLFGGGLKRLSESGGGGGRDKHELSGGTPFAAAATASALAAAAAAARVVAEAAAAGMVASTVEASASAPLPVIADRAFSGSGGGGGTGRCSGGDDRDSEVTAGAAHVVLCAAGDVVGSSRRRTGLSGCSVRLRNCWSTPGLMDEVVAMAPLTEPEEMPVAAASEAAGAAASSRPGSTLPISSNLSSSFGTSQPQQLRAQGQQDGGNSSSSSSNRFHRESSSAVSEVPGARPDASPSRRRLFVSSAGGARSVAVVAQALPAASSWRRSASGSFNSQSRVIAGSDAKGGGGGRRQSTAGDAGMSASSDSLMAAPLSRRHASLKSLGPSYQEDQQPQQQHSQTHSAVGSSSSGM